MTGVAQAQTADPAAQTQAPPQAPAASDSAVNASGVVLLSSKPPEEQATLKAGDPNVVSNAPVPDTVANRAKYGRPLSNGGRHTPPKGN
jgi:hypothetical protein